MRKEFERVTPESVGVPSSAVEWLLDELEAGYTEPHGLMLMRHGKVFAEGWWTPYAPGLRHGLQSHTKTYAATAIGLLYTEGKLDLSERIVDIFPEEAPAEISENLAKLTIHDVLCMGTGMEEMPDPRSTEWIRDFLATPVVNEPGTRFYYNSVGSSLLCAIVKKKSGQDMRDYLIPRLYEPLGILYENHRWFTMGDGTPSGGGGLLATTEDNLRLLKLYLDGGVWEGKRILAEDFVKKATSKQNDNASEAKLNPGAWDNYVGYGYQLWMCRPEGVYRADGAMGQFTVVIPDMDMLISITEGAMARGAAQHTLDLFWGFLAQIPGGKRFRDIGPDPDFLASPAGIHCSDFGGEKTPAVPAVPMTGGNGEELAGDPKQQGLLLRRLDTLCLPRPPYGPVSHFADKICGKALMVLGGGLGLTVTGFRNKPAEGANVTERLYLTRRKDAIRLGYRIYVDGANKEEWSFRLGLDGNWRRSQFGKPEDPVTHVLGAACFRGENELEIQLRMPESCSLRTLILTLNEDGNEVNIHSMSNMPGVEPRDFTALVREDSRA